MKFMMSKAIRPLLSIFLIMSSLTGFSARLNPISTTTLALVYDEYASVLHCGIQESIISTIPEIHQVTIEVSNAKINQKIEKYSACQGITQVYEVQGSMISLIPADPFYTQGKQWNLTNIGLQSAWDITTGSADVIVAVIDTGVSTTSPYTDFGSDGVLLGASIINGITREDATVSQYSYDGGSHGTAVASLISANMNSTGLTGIAPGVKILPVKVFRDAAYQGELVSALGTDIAAAIIWATNHGADIINMSLGGSADSATQSAVEYAYDHGVILVAASGNNSNNSGGNYFDVAYPAAYPQVIAVGSLTEGTTVSDFSNVAGTGLDLSAYGENILLPWVAYNNYYYLNGTSFSSPTVAGVLALMKSAYPALTPEEAKAILLSGVSDITGDIYSPGWDAWTGYGMVNAIQALLQVNDYLNYHDTNTDFASAQFIYGHHAYANQLRPALDMDFYTFTLYETDDVTITISPGSIQDLLFKVYDQNQNLMITVDDGGSAETETVTLSAVDAGTYTIEVSDFESRGYLSDYQIEVDYASKILPIISASTDNGNLSAGQSTTKPVQLSIVESLYHTVTVTKDGLVIAMPEGELFTQAGYYVITVDDVLYDPVSFDFSIVTAAGVENNGVYNSDRFIEFMGTATLNGNPFSSGTLVSAEGIYTLIINNAGQETTILFTIDKTAPIITIGPYNTVPTDQDITVSASVNEGNLNFTSHTFTENGSFTFTASDLAGNVSSTTITITNIHKVTSVVLNKTQLYLYDLGAQEQLTVTVNPGDAFDQSVTWDSSASDIVSVDQNGLISALAVGIATITVTSIDGLHSASVVVEVVLQRQLDFQLIGVGGSMEAFMDLTKLQSGEPVKAGSALTFTVTLSPRYRLYRWIINDVIQSTPDLSLALTIGPSDLNVKAEVALIGDLNLTDDVTTTDLVQLRRYLAGLDQLSDKGIFSADINGDGSVTTTDLVQLRGYLAGLQ